MKNFEKNHDALIIFFTYDDEWGFPVLFKDQIIMGVKAIQCHNHITYLY